MSDIRLDFSRMSYGIHEIPEDEDFIERFPDLLSQAHIFLSDIPEGGDDKIILRWLIYMYAQGSPMRNAYPNLNTRKQACMKRAGVVPGEDGKIPEVYQRMCNLKESWIISKFIVLTRLQKSEDYAVMHTAEQAMANLQDAILSLDAKDLKAGDNKKLKDDYESWRDTLQKARERIMGDETSLHLRDEITFSVKSDSLNITPQDTAIQFRETGTIHPDIIA